MRGQTLAVRMGPQRMALFGLGPHTTLGGVSYYRELICEACKRLASCANSSGLQRARGRKVVPGRELERSGPVVSHRGPMRVEILRPNQKTSNSHAEELYGRSN